MPVAVAEAPILQLFPPRGMAGRVVVARAAIIAVVFLQESPELQIRVVAAAEAADKAA